MSLRDEIYAFCKRLTISSKEQGLRPLWPLMGSQKYALDEILKGIEEKTHTFVILKARQLGITTIANALDLFWISKYKGTQATLVSDDEGNRDKARATLTQFMESLPFDLRIPVRAHNRIHLVLANRSRVVYQIAGTKAKVGGSDLGKGEGISYMHCTECGSWADQQGLSSLMASLAERNPHRLYLFESTAKGFNLWTDVWESANRSISQKPIFIGWWRNENYAYKEDSREFQVYWDGSFTGAEKEWISAVKKLYDFDITPEQVAWYRFQLAEKYFGDESALQEQHPATADMAFVMSGSAWFHPMVLTKVYERAHKLRHLCRYARFNFGQEFTATQLLNANERTRDLCVWESPSAAGYYVIGADPAEGSSANADDFAISVWRCYADRMEQVAEYQTVDINTYEFAWAMLALAGAYRARYILEINGCGGAVYQEIKNIRRQAFASKYMSESGQDKEMGGLRDAVKNIRDYYYQRIDMAGGKTNAVHWKTNSDNKRMVMSLLRDLVTRGIADVRSEALVQEMRKVRRQDDGDIRADGNGKDDLVIAAALACVCWYEDIRPQLMQRGLTKQKSVELEAKGEAPKQSVEQMAVINYLRKSGLVPMRQRKVA
jgi:hypothetical protein